MATLSQAIALIRSVIGDDDADSTLREYTDAQITGWLSAAFMMERVPTGYVLDTNLETITPDPASGDVWGIIVLRAAQLGVMPREAAYSYKTRPLSVTQHGKARKELLTHLSNELFKVESGGCAFAGEQDLVNWVFQVRGSWGGATVEAATVDPHHPAEISFS